MSKSVLPVFYSRRFIVSGLIFRFLIHFEFIFVYDVGECSNFILHAAVLFSQNHLLKRLSFFHSMFLHPLLTIGTWVYLWAFYPVPLIYISVFVPVQYCFDNCSFVVSSEVREPDSSISVFLFQYCFGYSGSSVFPHKF